MTIQPSNAAIDSSMFEVQSSKLAQRNTTLNFEHGTLSSARRGGHDSPELHKAFSDFVGQTFFGELLKQMRATVDKNPLFHGGMGEEVFQTQLDQIIVERITDS